MKKLFFLIMCVFIAFNCCKENDDSIDKLNDGFYDASFKGTYNDIVWERNFLAKITKAGQDEYVFCIASGDSCLTGSTTTIFCRANKIWGNFSYIHMSDGNISKDTLYGNLDNQTKYIKGTFHASELVKTGYDEYKTFPVSGSFSLKFNY
ncbi:MAG: hypothetical protein RBT65_15880 [Methanolobus sp.]|nr:hypothetical protein [Methanolobus sp.]